MNIYPAIDLYEGKVVRLVRGDYNQQTVYSERPEEFAREWEAQGAEWLHVVDLEGAKTGRITNREALINIRKAVGCKIEFGGGLRDTETVRGVLADGIDRVVIGTKAMDEPFLTAVLREFGGRVAIGMDVRSGEVQMEGWLKAGGRSLHAAIEFLNNFPVETLIYTDIQKDGMLGGPNFPGLLDVLRKAKSRVILSGGIGSLEDVQAASQISAENFEGAIIGKALYEKKFTVREAIELARQASKKQDGG